MHMHITIIVKEETMNLEGGAREESEEKEG